MGHSDSNAAFYHSQLVILCMRITKVTTKTGDAGQTSLGTGQKVKKDHPRVNVLGELDHLNSIFFLNVLLHLLSIFLKIF